MLRGECTAHGAGIRLSGDYYDFHRLHETIHYLVGEDSDMQEFVLGLAYEVRKAKSGQREIVMKGSDDEPSTYYSVDILWPEFLAQVSMLRNLAAFKPTDSAIQSDLYRLEACIENALNEHDSNISQKVMGWVKEFGFVSKDYLTEFVFIQCREFVFSGTTLKARLKKLPSFLSRLFPQSADYKVFEKELQELAKAQGSHPQDFHDWTEWPEFKW
ncbi:MAG: hypothetical protein LWW76_07115 [Burkholderiales bacterium]|nr:hypothetical protein [Burkholderiales bacterium]